MNIASALKSTGVAAVAALAHTAFAGTATYDLSRQYEPYLTATETTIWENRDISEIESFTCTVKGGWIGTATAGIGVIYDRTATSFTVQFQCVNGGCKMVRAYFRQDGANIVARADKAGRVDESGYGSVQPNSAFTTSLATSDSANGYGVKMIDAFGDVAQTINDFPVGTDAVVVDGGILQINVPGDTTIATPISGTGGLRFHGSGVAVETQHTFDQYVTTANQTLIENADVFDIEITSAVFNGGWCGRAEGALPYNVTSNLQANTMKVQLQKTFPNGVTRGLVIQLSQSGGDVVVKGVFTQQSGDGQPLGSDMETWTGAKPSIATSSSGSGYGLESISFVKRALPMVILDGTKSWTGGTVADGCKVKVTASQLAAGTTAKAVNGGILELAAAGVWNVCPRNNFVVSSNSTLRVTGNFAINQYDTLKVTGGTVRVDVSNLYVNDALFADGATWSGKAQVAYQQDAYWRTEGESDIEFFTPLTLVANNSSRKVTLDTAADIVFHEGLEENPNYPGASLVKRGAAKATFVTGGTTTGQLRVEDGAVAFGGDAGFGALAVAGSGGIEVAAGKTLAFGDSSSVAWTAGAALSIIGEFGDNASVVRFGTDANGLTSAQLKQIRINGESCELDANGWLHPVALAFVISVR